ncbi:MAG TPA: accessory gene regulator B family protein [Ruminococcus sp.]|nr:accessory gene regulator B family protein [Ruminococcus sp.]
MVHRLSKMIANFLLHKNVISETEIDIYIYGYETIILGIIDFFIVLTVGLIFNQFITMLTFFTMFISVRLYTGGYHANTVLKCKAVFISICISLVFLSELEFPYFLYILVMLLYLITSFFLAPIENYNKPLTSEEQMKYRRISIAMSLFWSVVAVISYFFAIKICTTITVTALFITLLMIIGEYGKGGKINEQE